MKLSTKLQLAFLFSSILPITSLSLYTLNKAEATFYKKEQDVLSSVVQDRSNRLDNFFARIESQLNDSANNSTVVNAVKDFTAAYAGLDSEDMFVGASVVQQQQQDNRSAVRNFLKNSFGKKR